MSIEKVFINQGVLIALSFARHCPEQLGIIEGSIFEAQIKKAYEYAEKNIQPQGYEVKVLHNEAEIERIKPR